ncbi:MAG: class I SAM-dependent methyltransferase [Chitinophaga sp.]|uniref:class I SAM-dependent methyltransferase n=1 Tax=Chitinophaga sp. TaxID=1869181 RepID=UPI001B042D5D|nr:class I SAM-dependent methyltransferase [Chitinophaga sp.]MBO9732872.1 class I SAM-dependent methyltransferase [Chitinophaga sp.]
MLLLSEKDLVWSAVVANCSMNRDRNASGINSYEREFKLVPARFLEEIVQENGFASWLDLCCGSGLALAQTYDVLAQKGLQQQVYLKGIDLLDTFPPMMENTPGISFEVTSVVGWQPDRSYDLITCSHGLHYLGDKLQVIAMACKALTPNGYFIAHLDIKNISIPAPVSLKQLFTTQGLAYNARTHLLTCKGPRNFKAGLTYLGADDQAGPNYTGQGAVNSHYDNR